MLKREGWRVNHKKVQRIWRQEGLKVPQKQPKRKRLWLNDGLCIRLKPSLKKMEYRAQQGMVVYRSRHYATMPCCVRGY